MSKKSLVVVVIISLILLFSVMIAGFVILLNKVSPQLQNESEAKTDGVVVKEGIGPIYEMDTFIVNLADPGGKRYLRITIALEVTSEKVVEELKKRLPQVKHQILMILPSKKVEDIQSVEGKNIAMNEIMTQLNALLKEGKITHLYFTEFVIQ